MYTYEYRTVGKLKPNNPFWVIVDQQQHSDVAHRLTEYLATATENLTHWSGGTEQQQAIAEWLLIQPTKNRYGQCEVGSKAGEYNSPLMALSGAVKKLVSNGCRPGHSDLSKVQIKNILTVIKGLTAFDSKLFPSIAWKPAANDTPKITNKLNSLFEVQR